METFSGDCAMAPGTQARKRTIQTERARRLIMVVSEVPNIAAIPQFQSALDLYNSAIFADESHLCHSDEQSVLNHAGDSMQPGIETGRVGNLSEVAVQNVMSFIGDVGISVRVLAQRYLCPERFDPRLDQGLSEGNHFNRQGELAEMRNQLRGFGHYNKMLRCRCDNLFPQQCSAAALDQVQLRINLVSPVDVNVDDRIFLQSGKRDAELLGQVFRILRRWNSHDSQSTPLALRQELDGTRCGR